MTSCTVSPRPVPPEERRPTGMQPVVLEVGVSHRPGLDVVTVAGELDLLSAARLRSVLRDPRACSQRTLVLDLSALGFIDCAGLRVLDEARGRARARSARLVLAVAPTAFVGRVLTITGLWTLFTTADSLEEAVALAGPA